MDEDKLYERLMTYGISYVSFRPRSKKEIFVYLQKKLPGKNDGNEKIVNRVIDRLTELGYVNDEKFASWWAEQRALHRPKGWRVITQELHSKGINPLVIERVRSLQQNTSSGQGIRIRNRELAGALQAIEKKRLSWKKFSPVEQKKKIHDFLLRRGFQSSTVYRVIDGVLGKGYNTDEDFREGE